MDKYAEYSTSSLKDDSKELRHQIFELRKADAAANAALITELEAERVKVEKEIRSRETAEIAEHKFPVTAVTSGKADNGLAKDMLVAVNQITVFDAGSEASEFVAELYNCYLNYVKGAPGLEPRFIKAAISRLGTDYQRQLLHSGEPPETWDALKSFIETNYSSKMTVYQKMHTLFELDPDHHDWTAYATRLENRINSVFNFVSDTFSKEKGGAQLTAKKLMEVWAVMIFLEKLKDSDDAKAYDYIVGQLDAVWNLNSVVTRAKGYLDRCIRDENLANSTQNGSFFGKAVQKNRSRGQSPKRVVTVTQKQDQKSSEGSKKKNQKHKEFLAWVKQNPGVCYGWAVKKNCRYEEKHGKPCPHSHSDSYTEENALFTQPDFQH
ncbi:MAG: hypothetical protein CMO47_00665 [Verrucomicrobiales bacterium]|nr:hypothetical protein [Verrucomicrobiales bacterium]